MCMTYFYEHPFLQIKKPLNAIQPCTSLLSFSNALKCTTTYQLLGEACHKVPPQSYQVIRNTVTSWPSRSFLKPRRNKSFCKMVSDEVKTSWGVFLPAIPFRKLVPIAMIQVWNSSGFYWPKHTHSLSMPTRFCTSPTLPPAQLLFSPLPTSWCIYDSDQIPCSLHLAETNRATLLRLSVTLPLHHSHLGVLSPTGCCQGCTQIKPHQRHAPRHYSFPHNCTTASYLPFFMPRHTHTSLWLSTGL